MEKLLFYIDEYPYLILLIGSILDQSGIPMFTVMGGMLYAKGVVNFLPTFLTILFSFSSTDVLLIFLGKFLIERNLVFKKNKKIKTLDINLLEKSYDIHKKNKNVFYYFSKMIPTLGKYTPIFSGFEKENIIKSSLKYTIGDIIYIFIFFIPSIYIGEYIKQESLKIGIILLALFLILYKISEKIATNKLKK